MKYIKLWSFNYFVVNYIIKSGFIEEEDTRRILTCIYGWSFKNPIFADALF